MGKRTVEIRFCDCCSKELVGRLTFRTCPLCHKDVCLACIEKENTKHKPRERKPKAEPLSAFSITQTTGDKEPVIENIKKKGAATKQAQIEKPTPEKAASPDLIIEDEPETADKKGDNLTIHTPTGLDGDTEYKVNIAGSEASGTESVGLRLVVLTALEEWSGKIPDELSKKERDLIQGILDAGE